MVNRPSIPAELKRRVLVEAGHRCAIATCRHPTTELAHIVPFSEVRCHEYHNLIALCPNCHTRYDRDEIDRKSMMVYKRKVAFLSDRYSKFELNVLDYLRTNRSVSVYGYLLVKNIIDDGLVYNAHTIATFDYLDGRKEVQEFVVASTGKGKEFIKAWQDSMDESLTYEGAPG